MPNNERWFSTGYLASGVGAVNADQHALTDAAVIRTGEARGHDLWIDDEFCAAVQRAGSAMEAKGIKARFGHPDMCSDALGTFLGRWKGLAVGTDGVVRGTLFLSSVASESPKGDLRKYVEEMAAKEPGHFGTSIVFSRDRMSEESFMSANEKEEDSTDEITGQPIKIRRFKSPDARNVKNFPHARLGELHAADLVDDPAATDGMFSGLGGAALAAQVSEFLDTHPEVLKAFAADPQMIDILSRYSAELKPFVDRYTANRKDDKMSTEATGAAESTPATEQAPAAETTPAAEPKAEEAEPAEPVQGEETGAELSALKTENETIKAQLAKAQAEKEAAELKLKALTSGADPLSATPAPTKTTTGNMWHDARASARK